MLNKYKTPLSGERVYACIQSCNKR